MAKLEVYKRIKIAGMLSFIPFILAAGIFSGYFLGKFIEDKFGLSLSAIPIFIGIGILASVVESVRIIKLVLNMEKKD